MTGGKIRWLVVQALYGKNVLVVCNTHRRAMELMSDVLASPIMGSLPYPKVNRKNRTIVIGEGSLQFQPTNRGEEVFNGKEWNGLFIEESAHLDDRQIALIQSRIREEKE